jgi:hypothetical protein
MPSLIDMKKKSVIVGSCMGAIIGLLFFMETTIVMGVHNSTDNNCISIECLKVKLKRICKEGSGSPYLDCDGLTKCDKPDHPGYKFCNEDN